MQDDQQTASQIAEAAYLEVFRTDFSHPGFALFNLGPEFGSLQQRRLMVLLKDELARLDHRHRGRFLYYQSLGRFDQQATTKPHRDGGPDESILMLGYEPTVVQSRISLLEYSKCAFELGITPAEFLDRNNPMFPDGLNRLANYTTTPTEFDHSSFLILVINNSVSAFGKGRLQGVLHTAEIVTPDAEEVRLINSTMIGCGNHPKASASSSDVADFISTDQIRRATYQ